MILQKSADRNKERNKEREMTSASAPRRFCMQVGVCLSARVSMSDNCEVV